LRLTYRTEQDIEVGEGRCSGVAFVATLLSRIAGKIVDAEGKPVPDVNVNLVPVDSTNKVISTEVEYQAFTAKDGRYSFDTLSQGRYLLAVNPKGQPRIAESPYRRTYYPGSPDSSQATVIALAEGQEINLDDLLLPPRLVEAKIEGIVLWPDGRPAREARVSLEFTEQQWTEQFKQVDEQGRFLIECYEGFKYIVHAEVGERSGAVHAEPFEITVGKENRPLTLIVNQQGFDRKYTQKKTL